MKPPERELTKEEFDAWKTGNRAVRSNILRGHKKIRINHALEVKLQERQHKAKKARKKARRKERMQRERLQKKFDKPMIGGSAVEQ